MPGRIGPGARAGLCSARAFSHPARETDLCRNRFSSRPLALRGVTAPNRCVVSPMVQYRATDGQVNDYHLVHLGKFALGKFGIVFTENCAVEPRGRVTQGDLGLWDDRQIEGHRRLVRFLKQEGRAGGHADHPCRPQGQHAALVRQARGSSGRRAPAGRSWQVVGPSELPAADGWTIPRQLEADEHRRHREEVRRGGAPRRCRRLRRDRDPRRTWLPAGAVPFAHQQHAQRPVWRRPRRPHALPAGRREGGARELAGAQADVHPRLDGRRRRAAGRSRTPSSTPRN